MAVAVHHAVAVVMPVVDRLLPVGPRVLAEHQRLHRDRHRERGHADAAEVDEVEAPQRDAVDPQHLAG